MMKKWFGKVLFKRLGRQLEGSYPPEGPKKIFIVGPPTSRMDFFIGLCVKFWLEIKADWYEKKEWFHGIMGTLRRTWGGHQIDRDKHQNLVNQVEHNFNRLSQHTVIITPEGTRRKVSRFRTGFYDMALGVHVPIIPISFNNGSTKKKILSAVWVEGLENEIEQIEDLFRGVKGKHIEKSF